MATTTKDTPGRGHNGRYTRTADTARRDAEAAQLRACGASYQHIADQLNFANRSAARKAVQRALADTVREPAEEVRQIQLAQLDRLTREALKVLERTHIHVSQGRVVKSDDGVPLEDDAPVLNAIDRLLKIQERRAKLLGLDAPSKVEVLSLDAIDAEISRLSAELGRSEAGTPGAAS
jgi:hypothetical protein